MQRDQSRDINQRVKLKKSVDLKLTETKNVMLVEYERRRSFVEGARNWLYIHVWKELSTFRYQHNLP